jgi:micrococcal nuclease
VNPALVPAAIVTVALAALSAGCGQDPSRVREPGDAGESRVVRVTDGDTIVVRRGGTDDRVRLLGIDTPEVRGPFTDEECFGPEASRRMRMLAAPGTTVRLEIDPTQDERDRNGRLLAYVSLPGEPVSLNERMVADGYARKYVVGRPFLLAGRFGDREKAARQARRGLWGVCGTSPRPKPASTPGTGRDCPPDRPIKGNLPSRIYHRPGDPSYDETKPEECFATARDAETAGFRPPRG